MEVILDFDFKLNKAQIFQTLKSYGEILGEEEIKSLYSLLLPTVYEAAEPSGVFSIEKKDNNFHYEIMKNYSHIVYCIITLGDDCNKKINEFFSYGDMKKGMVMDAMLTSYLFEASSQLFNHIYNKSKELNLGLSCRISPGDGELPLEYQKNILEKLDAENFLNLTVTEGFMLSSNHSMAYVYGADKNLPLSKKDHDCSRCPNQELCAMKNL
jgi:hypothetical protein